MRDFRIVQFSTSRQFELLRGVEHDSLLFDFMVEVLSQFEVFIQPGNTFVDELRPGVKFALFVFEKPFGDAGVNVVFLQAEPSARDDQNVVVAHEKGRHPVIPPTVAIDVHIPGVTAVKNNHYAIFYFVSDDLHKLMQITSFFRRQEVDRTFHAYKVSKKIETPNFYNEIKILYLCVVFSRDDVCCSGAACVVREQISSLDAMRKYGSSA